MGSGVLENRFTSVYIDYNTYLCLQPILLADKNATAIGQNTANKNVNVQLIKDIGWTLKSYSFDEEYLHETSLADAAKLTPANSNVTIDSSLVEKKFWKKPTNTGLTTAYISDVPTSGNLKLIPQVGATSSWARSTLAGDLDSFPPPNYTDNCLFDRMLISTDNHFPIDGLHFGFYVPGANVNKFQNIAKIYFTGPASKSLNFDGSGRYCIIFAGSGIALLFELKKSNSAPVNTDWRLIDTWYWSSSALIPGRYHDVYISSNSIEAPRGSGKYYGDTISIFHKIHQYPSQISATLQKINEYILNAKTASHIVHISGSGQNPSVISPNRVDIRRDIRAIFEVSRDRFPTTGTLYDDPIKLDFNPTDDQLLEFQWYGYIPSGCTLDAQVYNALTDTELTVDTASQFDEKGGWKRYSLPADGSVNQIYVKYTYSSSGTSTPILVSQRYLRQPVNALGVLSNTIIPNYSTTISLKQTQIDSINITGPDTDPSHEGANITLSDMSGSLSQLRVRAGMPIAIRTIYDGASNYSYLFAGVVNTVLGERRGRKARNYSSVGGTNHQYPGEDYNRFSLSCTGLWNIFSERLLSTRTEWVDKNTTTAIKGYGMKITDIIKTVAHDAGVDDSQLDIPDKPIRLFDAKGENYITDVGDNCGAFIRDLVRDYIGGYLVWDLNAGANGSLRLLDPKLPATSAPYYTNLAGFYLGNRFSSALSHSSEGYGNDTTYTQTMIRTFIKKGTLDVKIVPPEVTRLTVIGVGSRKNNVTGKFAADNELIKVTIVNTDSYNYLNLAPGDPNYPNSNSMDYVGRDIPGYIVDISLTSLEAVSWFAKRAMSYAGVGRKYITFVAPLILITDITDTKQTRPRPLRVNDPVLCELNEGTMTQCLVVNCNPMYTKDRTQLARYELLTFQNINNTNAKIKGLLW